MKVKCECEDTILPLNDTLLTTDWRTKETPHTHRTRKWFGLHGGKSANSYREVDITYPALSSSWILNHPLTVRGAATVPADGETGSAVSVRKGSVQGNQKHFYCGGSGTGQGKVCQFNVCGQFNTDHIIYTSNMA